MYLKYKLVVVVSSYIRVCVPSVVMSEDTRSSFGAWTRYFEGISRFLEGAEHQHGTANRGFCEYVLERLELFINTCTLLCEQMLSTSNQISDEEERQITDQYQENLIGLVDCLRHIHGMWVDYEDMLDYETTRFRYQTERIVSTTGRPRFHIEKEQLEYLSSLNFSWTEIASLIGVSRMTVYR